MRIYVNQAGYLPESVKTIVLAEEAEHGVFSEKDFSKNMSDKTVQIYDPNGEKCLLEKKAKYIGPDQDSGDFIWQTDVSELTQEGVYQVRVEGKEPVSIRIHPKIYDKLNEILCKALYYQRCGMELEKKYAGIFQRKSCHEGKAVLLEDYEKLNTEKAGEVRWFDVRGGWHDAGDYGRYTTAAAAALAHMLYAYRLFPDSFFGNSGRNCKNESKQRILCGIGK